MGEPLIVVSTLRVKQGRLEDVMRYYKRSWSSSKLTSPN
jgi:hypothetical protein